MHYYQKILSRMIETYVLRNVHNKSSNKILEFIDLNTTAELRNDVWSKTTEPLYNNIMKQLSFQILDQTEDEILSKSD